MPDCSIFNSPHTDKSLYEKNKELLYKFCPAARLCSSTANFLEWLGDLINVDLLLAHAALKAG